MKYRKKPIEVEARQYAYPASQSLRAWMGRAAGSEAKMRQPGSLGEMRVHTLEDGDDGKVIHIATEGDWIIRGVQGELYPCKPDIFEATYEKVEA